MSTYNRDHALELIKATLIEVLKSDGLPVAYGDWEPEPDTCFVSTGPQRAFYVFEDGLIASRDQMRSEESSDVIRLEDLDLETLSLLQVRGVRNDEARMILCRLCWNTRWVGVEAHMSLEPYARLKQLWLDVFQHEQNPYERPPWTPEEPKPRQPKRRKR